MMNFRDLPIRRKVARMLILTGGVVLLLTSSAFMTYEWITFRGAALANLKTLSRIIAENSTAALRFKNETDARDTIATLRADPDIVMAAIYNETGNRIAFFSSAEPPPARTPPEPDDGHAFIGGHLVVHEPIVQDQHRLGTLTVESSLAGMQQRFVLYGAIVLAILGTSSLVAFALSSQLQRQITDPIQELAQTAQAIAANNDYSRRASRYGNDELGALTDAFNRMLDEIHEREQRLSASEERLRAALAAADMGTWRYYPGRRESIVDQNFRRIYGLPAGDKPATAEEMTACIFPDDRKQAWESLSRAIEGPDSHFVAEYRVVSPDGHLRWVRDRGRVVRGTDGSVDYVTGAIVDITERKHAEEEIQLLNTDLEGRVTARTAELEQANRELEAFTYSVSHDLRGPLRHMSGYAEIVHDDPASQLSAEAQMCLGRISSAATRLTQLVDSLLNLSRVGRKPLVLERTRLDDIVTTALRELDSETKKRRVEWHRQALPVVECDPSLLHIVFVNLLSNALKYSRPRDVAVITIGMEIQDRQTVIFVRDNGVGFDPRFQGKLFGVFERLHTASAFEGHGIGLATVDRIIRKHGGRIWAKSAVNEGATFYFTLKGM
jgi:PAS domain S-box-containing protein